MNEPITVEPDYTKSGIEASESYKNRVANAGAEYPLKISGHSVQVIYRFENDSDGLLKLMSIGYYCTDCDEQQHLRGDSLWKIDKHIRKSARKYMLGHFFETDC